MPLAHLVQPICRDLAWIAEAPPLLADGSMSVRDPLAGSLWRDDPERLHHALRQLDDDPVRLTAKFGESTDYRLGRYYERLWQVLLELAPDIRVIAHNVPVRHQRRSLGELDLIIEAADGAVIHFELAIKFYLGRPELDACGPCSAHSAWWGPDPKDRLDIKVDRLASHQLPLATRHADRLVGLPQIDRSCAWLQGCLFYPAGREMAPAEQAGVPAWRHEWCYRRALEEALPSGWIALPHKRWLAPPAMSADFSGSLAAEPFSRPGAPVMLINESRRDYCDAPRLLVMPDGWPDPIIPPRCGSAVGPDPA
ncbi:DUF1853 family protein [Halopseudomonas nanhaiensis]|uniref:DUF1853 family protein n=1 Tax=Halopseudomonas nanhaiensis TaxID=2830842 RepID=UPI001CBCE804|nr:DUF1853 family protein [Halopseudomonas nanhaiensis]UAW97092.1 DUF1853 family protein [Halopseudomonas nanhaiensis]